MDGTVQVFAQTGQSPEFQQSLWDDEDMNGYQLLNEVGSGGTLSSLFTILSLFTEDVQMSWQDEYPDVSSDDSHIFNDPGTASPPHMRRKRSNSDVLAEEPQSINSQQRSGSRRSSISSSTSTINPRGYKSPSRADSSSPTQDYDTPSASVFDRPPPKRRPTQTHRGVVARAAVDSTLAVIPAEAFRRLTKKYPKATGHIVQGLIKFIADT